MLFPARVTHRLGACPHAQLSRQPCLQSQTKCPPKIGATRYGDNFVRGDEHATDPGMYGRWFRQEHDSNYQWICQNFGTIHSYGTLEFENQNRASFVRMAPVPQTNPQTMIDLMLRLRYSLPRLVISVTGGAQDFEMSKDLQTVLRRGLRRVGYFSE